MDSKTASARRELEWHSMGCAEVAAALGVAPARGLDAAEVAARRARCGPNRLPEPPPRPAWRVFAAQFRSLLIVLLLVAACLALAIGEARDAAVIAAVVLVNASIGFAQERRAQQSLAALRAMLTQRARVRRDGAVAVIAAEELVPGDVVLVEAGDQVPADARLVVAAALAADESTLTGESLPEEKAVDAVDAAAPLADRPSMLYMNTLVTRGRGEAIVTATGADSEMGRIALALTSAEERRSPLEQQLDQLGRRLGALVLVLVGLLAYLGVVRGSPVTHVILDAIALAVAGVPEGLPVVVTVTLALGMQRMAQQHAIVKRLASVETLGCATVICSDKTGTLTLNQMTARAVWSGGRLHRVEGEGYVPAGRIVGAGGPGAAASLEDLLVAVAACNDSRVVDGRPIGDPTEAALIVLAAKGGIDAHRVSERLPRVAEVPFDPAHRFMATLHRDGTRAVLFAKGAPEVLVERCAWTAEGAPFGAPERAALLAAYERLAAEGLRGLLVATRALDADALGDAADPGAQVVALRCLGLVGLADPPRPEAREAIATCRRAGVAVKMITGDHPETALAIARELGLDGGVVTGRALDVLAPEARAAEIERATVFARVSPEHKVAIVRALQARGHVVAMTGDGVNDAPALRCADIGVAMGGAGTEVAKAAAGVVLADDRFATIVAAVHAGRALYDNIVKFVRFQLSTTLGAIATVFFAPLAGLPELFHPIQILWVAMIMDGPPAVSLAFDAARPGLMEEAPRPRSEPVLSARRLAHVAGFGAVMMAGTLAVYRYALDSGPAPRAETLAFTTFVWFQLFNVPNARAERASAFGRELLSNRALALSLAAVAALQVVAVEWGAAQAVFRTVGLAGRDWALAIGVASSILWLEEARKVIARRVVGSRAAPAGDRA